jgi:hypothetical protein
VRHFNGPLKMDILAGVFFRNSQPRDFTAVLSTRYASGEWVFPAGSKVEWQALSTKCP